MVCGTRQKVANRMLTAPVIILTLPWLPMRRLQLPLRKKVAVTGILLLGALVVVADGARINYLYAATGTTDLDYACKCKTLLQSSNPLVNGQCSDSQQPAFLWIVVEACIGTIAACLPCLGPIFHGRSVGSLVANMQTRVGTLPDSAERLRSQYVPSRDGSSVNVASRNANNHQSQSQTSKHLRIQNSHRTLQHSDSAGAPEEIPMSPVANHKKYNA